MELNSFLKTYQQTGCNNEYAVKYKEVGDLALNNLPELSDLFKESSGKIFENGLFRIHNTGSFYLWTELSFDYFKKFKGKSYCFAFDWVGRQFAVNYLDGKSQILMLDPATAEVFTLNKNVASFLNEDLVEFKDELMDIANFNSLRKKLNVDKLKFNQCMGFKKFLFLGGSLELDNYEVIDEEVYWELNYQVYLQTKNLPPGTLLNVSIK